LFEATFSHLSTSVPTHLGMNQSMAYAPTSAVYAPTSAAGGPLRVNAGAGPAREVYGAVAPAFSPEPIKYHNSSKLIFTTAGIVLLALLCVVPVWNAVALMSDSNFVFWVGRNLPVWMIVFCFFLIVLYIITILTFFTYARLEVQNEQTIMMIANVFITLLGLVLMLVSLPLSRSSVETYHNLMHRCDYSEQTHRMYEYSQVLQNIRSTPECMAMYSVEECVGYADAPPYTTFLKAMETDFRCSGFCYRPPADVALVAAEPGAISADAPAADALVADAPEANAAEASAPDADAPENIPLLQQSQKKHRKDRVTPLALLSTIADKIGGVSTAVVADSESQPAPVASRYPPSLFSDANYQASCEGMAARDMKNFAGDVGYQTFYQGIYLVVVAVTMGFLKLVGFCVRRSDDRFGPKAPIL